MLNITLSTLQSNFEAGNVTLLTLIGAAALWEVVWKGFALWRSAQAGHKIWFIVLLLFNTLGIVPIIYLLLHRRPHRHTPAPHPPSPVTPQSARPINTAK